jgi:hypothetical protein
MRWARYIARMEEVNSVFKILISKPTGNNDLGIPRGRWGGQY